MSTGDIERDERIEAACTAFWGEDYWPDRVTDPTDPDKWREWMGNALDAADHLGVSEREPERSWRVIREIEKVLTDHDVAITAPLVDAVLEVLHERDQLQSSDVGGRVRLEEETHTVTPRPCAARAARCPRPGNTGRMILAILAALAVLWIATSAPVIAACILAGRTNRR